MLDKIIKALSLDLEIVDLERLREELRLSLRRRYRTAVRARKTPDWDTHCVLGGQIGNAKEKCFEGSDTTHGNTRKTQYK